MYRGEFIVLDRRFGDQVNKAHGSNKHRLYDFNPETAEWSGPHIPPEKLYRKPGQIKGLGNIEGKELIKEKLPSGFPTDGGEGKYLIIKNPNLQGKNEIFLDPVRVNARLNSGDIKSFTDLLDRYAESIAQGRSSAGANVFEIRYGDEPIANIVTYYRY